MDGNQPEPAMRQVRFEVTGMHCGHCLESVRSALSRLPGVHIERIELGSATLQLETASSPADIIDAIDDAGYEAREVAT